MFERFRNRSDTRDDYVDENGGGVATATRHDTNGDGVVEERPVAAAPVTRENVRDVRARQRAEYGGLNWGSAFFGWLVAVGMAAILLGLLSAAGTAFGLSDVSEAEARSNAETIGIVGGNLRRDARARLLRRRVRHRAHVALRRRAPGLPRLVARPRRDDRGGGRLGVRRGVQRLQRLGLPRIPIDEGSLTAGAAIALAAAVILSLLAAMGGGKAGERYHRRIDRLGYTD